MRFHSILLELDLCQIIARYKQFLWCYSQNSRPMPKKGQKAHSNIHSYIPIVEKAHWLFQLTIQELNNYQIPASSWQYLQCYSHNGVYMSKTRKKRTQMSIQMPHIHDICGVINQISSCTQNPKKVHLQY